LIWFLYLDESGDLGFDFINKRPSSVLTVTILLVKGTENNRALINAVKKTIKRKLDPRKRRQGTIIELKGESTSLDVKKYFLQQLVGVSFELFCVTLNKRQISNKLTDEKHRIYNFMARLALVQVPFEDDVTRVELIIDKSKNKAQMQEFNSYFLSHLEGKLDPKIPLDIQHRVSNQEYGLQAADMFFGGVFRKHGRADTEWFSLFKEKVRYDMKYP